MAPYDPYQSDLANRLSFPGSVHWLGTDAVGRDPLSRILYASRTSLMVGIGAVCISAVIGQFLGLISGYCGGWVLTIIMRLIDAMLSIPMLVLAMVLGGGLKNVIIALGAGGIPMHCRMMCGQVMSIRENDYVLAGRTIGLSDLRMMLKHIFPNAFPPLLVTMTIGLGGVILSEAGLSFLGVGINPQISAAPAG